MKAIISYSNLLIQFIEPLINGDEDSEEFLMKAKIGQLAWNHCFSVEYELPFDQEMKTALKNLTEMYPDAKATLNMLAIRKSMKFGAYGQFIFKVECRHKPDGSVNLYVESAPADKMVRKIP